MNANLARRWKLRVVGYPEKGGQGVRRDAVTHVEEEVDAVVEEKDARALQRRHTCPGQRERYRIPHHTVFVGGSPCLPV